MLAINPDRKKFLQEAANKAKEKFDSIQELRETDEQSFITHAREFIREFAKHNEWDTARFFLYQLENAEIPLYKLNLVGWNSEALIGQIEQAPDLQAANKELSMFVAHLYSFCHSSQLENPSDNFYYTQHPEERLSKDIQMMGVGDDLTINYES